MEHLSVTVEEETVEYIEELAEERDSSRSQIVRELIADGQQAEEYKQQAEELQERLDSREARIDELEGQLTRRSQLEEKVDTLAKQQDEEDAPFFIKWYRWWERQQD
jgi:predicted transcriptional regulator